MNTARRIDTAIACTATVAAGALFATIITALVFTSTPGLAQATATAAPVAASTIVQLPRVVVTNRVQRPVATAQIIELPRVVVTVRRGDVAPTLVTAAERGNTPRT